MLKTYENIFLEISYPIERLANDNFKFIVKIPILQSNYKAIAELEIYALKRKLVNVIAYFSIYYDCIIENPVIYGDEVCFEFKAFKVRKLR
jgi:hypothetical protein